MILENAYLSDEQIVEGSRLGERAGAEFIKTSTGFAPGGATVHDLLLMAGATSPKVQIKAAAGFARWTGCSSLSPSGLRGSAQLLQRPSWTKPQSAVPTARPSPFRPHPATKTLPTL